MNVKEEVFGLGELDANSFQWCLRNPAGSTVGNIKWKIHCKHFLNCDGNGTLESVKLHTLI